MGGDKETSSFKTSVQVINVLKPSSVKNSCVFAVFEAPDFSWNLHITLDKYHSQIDDLQDSCWK